MRWTVVAREQTGFIRGSLLLSCGMVTFFLLFFCSSNVQVTLSAFSRLGSCWESSLLPTKKRMCFNWQSFVFLSLAAFKYLYKKQAQKNAVMAKLLRAFYFVVVK